MIDLVDDKNGKVLSFSCDMYMLTMVASVSCSGEEGFYANLLTTVHFIDIRLIHRRLVS